MALLDSIKQKSQILTITIIRLCSKRINILKAKIKLYNLTQQEVSNLSNAPLSQLLFNKVNF